MAVNNVFGPFGPIDIATSGMRAHNKHMEVISSNIAHARTTDAGNGQPYRRLEASFKADGDEISGVSLDKILPDQSNFIKILNPGHPHADSDGYVLMPNVNLPTELINLNIATRTYQANAVILKKYQKMVETTLELLR
ncbi:MAG: flagellar basal body rod protein FlgC [Planctomycetota bacterium]|jgi:flagellar basal-body rod protein FlgC